jgi:hypothetical protein
MLDIGDDIGRTVDGEATAVLPLRHRARVIARQQAAAHEDAQQAPAHTRRHRGDGWRIEPGGGVEDNPAPSGGVEHAVDDTAMLCRGLTCLKAARPSAQP